MGLSQHKAGIVIAYNFSEEVNCMDKMLKKLTKNNAISFLCWDIISPEVWRVYAKYQRSTFIHAKIYVHKKLFNRTLYQVEFIGDLAGAYDDIKHLNPKFMRKRNMLARIVKAIRR